MQNVQSLQKFKTYEDYLSKNSFDITPTFNSTERSSKNCLNGNPHFIRVETE